MKNVSAIITGLAVALIALGVNAAETAAPAEHKETIKEEIKKVEKKIEKKEEKKEDLKEMKEEKK